MWKTTKHASQKVLLEPPPQKKSFWKQLFTPKCSQWTGRKSHQVWWTWLYFPRRSTRKTSRGSIRPPPHHNRVKGKCRPWKIAIKGIELLNKVHWSQKYRQIIFKSTKCENIGIINHYNQGLSLWFWRNIYVTHLVLTSIALWYKHGTVASSAAG